MENKVNGERKKLSLSSGGKLTLKNSIIANKPSNGITANSRAGRGTVQVEVKRTKRLFNRSNFNENMILGSLWCNATLLCQLYMNSMNYVSTLSKHMILG